MSDFNEQSDYLWSIAGKRLGYMAGKGATALAGSVVATHLAYKYGWNVHLEVLQAIVAGVVLLVTEWIHDWLKVKTGISWL